MGQAFGGAATDALFGAGSGNVLTKATKWGAAVFFALAITLTIMGTYKTSSGTGGRLQKIMNENKPAATVPAAKPAAETPATPTVPAQPAANNAAAPVTPAPTTPPANTPANPAK